MIIDVSKHQGTISWDLVAPSLDFCILKASGKTKDTMFDRNVSECKRLKVPYHVYHYLYSVSEKAAVDEAKLFSDSVGNNSPLFWVLDMEYKSIADKKARAIAEKFEEKLRLLRGNDIQVAVYIGNELYSRWALNYSRYAYVWIPRYKKNDDGQPTGTKPSHYCDLWQYSSKGKVKGISGDVDMDILAGNKPMGFFTGELNGFTEVVESVSSLGRRTLRKGSKGDDVRELQRGLIKMGFSVGKWGADGDFGGATKTAVMEFQKKYGLVADGIFGPKSYARWRIVA